MITVSEAYIIAERYAQGQGEVSHGIRYGVGNMEEFKECYYFDLRLIFTEPPKPDVAFGGAPGFVVDKTTGETKTIASWQLALLR